MEGAELTTQTKAPDVKQTRLFYSHCVGASYKWCAAIVEWLDASPVLGTISWFIHSLEPFTEVELNSNLLCFLEVDSDLNPFVSEVLFSNTLHNIYIGRAAQGQVTGQVLLSMLTARSLYFTFSLLAEFIWRFSLIKAWVRLYKRCQLIWINHLFPVSLMWNINYLLHMFFLGYPAEMCFKLI